MINQDLHDALKENRIDLITQILQDQGINTQDENGKTVLHLAVNLSNPETFEFLLQQSADPNIQDKEKDTPLHLAAMSFNPDKVDLLLKHGANPHVLNLDSHTPHQSVSTTMLASYAKTTITDSDKEKAFQIIDLLGRASGQVHPTLGIPIPQIDFGGALFRQLGLDVNALGQDGWTMLQRAIIKKDLNAINEFLKDREIELHKPSKYGYKALDIAILKDDPEILEALLQKINPNDPATLDDEGSTPLHLAAKFLRPNAVKILLKHQANIFALNKQSAKPIEVTTDSIEGFIELTQWWKHGPFHNVSLAAFGFPDREDIKQWLQEKESSISQDDITHLSGQVDLLGLSSSISEEHKDPEVKNLGQESSSI
ncbi:ANK repeat containing protein [Candidatus Phycorickettsia trachydisci]|uniref:ANK repeat containing protein n=1 Tax=Candidatus Phycorickettsia trachydisci TaxID=2115978 RepID=A0A2P1P793_9RICK|nr:ankyrin repeat domain-containing protein [Candidatus Phycorickettsia trachydisci]AVP87126.1 ANK repeat containing protein [Candidatus Phycorickettsia trachydisci]